MVGIIPNLKGCIETNDSLKTHLHTLELFQTFIHFFLLLNTKKYIFLRKWETKQLLVPIYFFVLGSILAHYTTIVSAK